MTVLSAIIPTRNRLGLLRDCLQTLANQDVPADSFEIIVVDDGSEYDPSEIAGGFQSESIPIHVERQSPAGLNVARNTGAAVARGKILGFLDDDTLVDSGWAKAVIDGFEKTGCEALAGRILLQLEGPEPRWLSPRMRSYLSELDLGQMPLEIAQGPGPFGANCAVAQAAFGQTGGFRAGLDRVGTSLVSNGDTEFFDRLRASGGRVAYWPEAFVLHRVLPERLTLGWMRRRAFAQGVSDGIVHPPAGHLDRAARMSREIVRAGRSGPIFVRNLLEGRGPAGAQVWIAYCHGRIAALGRAQTT